MSSFRRGWRALAAAAIPAVALAVGCQSFNFHPLHQHQGPRDGPAPTAAEPQAEVLARPGKYQFRIAPYVFLSDFEIQRDKPLFRELASLRDQVYKELRLPASRAVVEVYLFETKERYEQFMQARYPRLPTRRAFFIAQERTLGGPEDLLVYTYWSDLIRQDLRHELTHALLHSVIRDVPLWLDEGLAEYFELPPADRGINSAHLRNLLAADYQPDLDRLEALVDVNKMNRPEYREAWGWVHLMMNSGPEARAVLIGYLQQLRAGRYPNPQDMPRMRPLLAKVFPSPETSLRQHLGRLDANPNPRERAAR
jgi:hypothetical protein